MQIGPLLPCEEMYHESVYLSAGSWCLPACTYKGHTVEAERWGPGEGRDMVVGKG